MRGCVNLVLFSSKQASKHAFLLILETTLLAGLQFRRDQVRDEGVWQERRQQGVRVWIPQVGPLLRQGRQGESE